MKTKVYFKRIIAFILTVIVILSLALSLTSCKSDTKVDKSDLLNKFNTFLKEAMEDGTYDSIREKWMSNDESSKDVDYSKLTGENGTIVFGTKTNLPFAYIKNDKYVGFVVDIAVKFCELNGYKIKIQDYLDTNSLVMATSMKKVDFGGCTVSINEERAESVDFSIPYLENAGALLALKENKDKFTDGSSITNKIVGVQTGTIYPPKIQELNPNAQIMQYNSVADLFEALETNKVDCIACDKAQVDFVISSHPDVSYCFNFFEGDYFGFIFEKQNTNTLTKTNINKQMDTFIKSLDNQGVLKEIIDTWSNNLDSYSIDYTKLTGKNGTLRVATVEEIPFIFAENGNFQGITADILYRFCLEKGYALEYSSYENIDSSIDAVEAGKADIAASAISITTEREKKINFSEPYFENTASVYSTLDNEYKSYEDLENKNIATIKGSVYPDIIKDKMPKSHLFEYDSIFDLIEALNTNKVDAVLFDDVITSIALKQYPNIHKCFTVIKNDYYGFAFKKNSVFIGIVNSISNSFNKTFIKENRYKQFLSGLLTTFLITISSVAAGMILGFLVFLLCKGGNKVSNVITNICKWLVDGMPVVVLLMIFYYIIFSTVKIDGIIVAIIVFTIIFMSAFYGILRVANDYIDVGQFEASYALGYSKNKTFFKIILPQMVRHMWTPFEQATIEHIKATAIVGFIAVQDLTKTGDMIRSSTYEAFFPLIVVAILYFLLSWLFICLIKFIHNRFASQDRKREKFLQGVKVEKTNNY